MPFPLTHLLVAGEILTRYPRPDADAAQVLLGSISPDAVHYREGLVDAAMRDIGAAKKISHLCPVSNERWGAITDNESWISNVITYLKNHTSPQSIGYAIHILTDIHNNMTLWENFRTTHPAQAAKGYESKYYQDLREIDQRIYKHIFKTSHTRHLLAQATPAHMSGLVTANEISAIQENILHKQYINITPTPGYKYTYVSYNDTLDFIQDTAKWCCDMISASLVI